MEFARYGGLVRPDGSQIRLSDFDGDAASNVAVYMRTIKHLFENMSVGDLVVVPGYGAYSKLLFGEITESVNFAHSDRIDPHYFIDTQYRPVKWLTRDRRKTELPQDLIKYIGKPPAIAEVARDALTDRFFDFAYDAYVKENESWSTFTAPNYTGDDPAIVSDVARLVQFAVSAFIAIEARADLSELTFDDIIDRFYDKALIEHFATSFNSPGRLDFRARNSRMGIFVAALVALTVAGTLSGCKDNPPAVNNSKMAADPISPAVQEQLRLLSNSIATPTAEKADQLGTKSGNAAGLVSVVKVRK